MIRDTISKLFPALRKAHNELEQQVQGRIQELVGANQSLRQNVELIQNFYNNAPCGYHTLDKDGVFLQINETELKWLGRPRGEVIGKIKFADLLTRESAETFRKNFPQVVEQGSICDLELQLARKDGTIMSVLLSSTTIKDAADNHVMSHSTVYDITERKWAEGLEEMQRQVLEQIASRTSLNEILTGLVLSIEEQNADMVGSVLLLDEDGLHLRHGAAPHLPEEYNQLVDGLEIGPDAGSCGTASFRRERVIVTDIATDPLWRRYVEIADRFSLRACWSQPFFSRDGNVLGTFAMYYRTPRSPSAHDLQMIETAAKLASIAMERSLVEKQLQHRALEFAALYDIARELATQWDFSGLQQTIVERAVALLGVSSCSVFLYDPAKGNLELVFAKDSPLLIGTRIALDTGMIGRVVESHQPTVVNDYGASEDRLPQFEGTGVRALMMVPMLSGGELIGVLGVAEFKTTRKFTDSDARLLSLFAAQAASAVKQARLREEARTHTAQLAVSEQRLRSILDNTTAIVYMLDTEGRYITVNRQWEILFHLSKEQVAGKTLYDVWPKEIANAFHIANQEVFRVRTPLEQEEVAPHGDGLHTYISLKFPLFDSTGTPYAICGISTDITERKQEERRKAAQYSITRVLAESTTLTEATPQLLKVICESLGWEMGELWRVDHNTNLIRCMEIWNTPSLDAIEFIAISRHATFAPGIGLPGQVWQSGQPTWIPNVMTDRNFRRAAVAAKAGLHSSFAFPILLENNTLGAMLFFSREIRQPDEDLLKMMSAIGSQIGQFIERKRAEQETRRLNRVYAVLSDINQAIVRIHDRQKLFDEACRIAVEVGQFRMAWIGCVDDTLKTVKIAACHDHNKEYLEHLNLSISEESSRDQEPTGTAIREGRTMISNDIEREQMSPWREETLKWGYRSFAVLPLKVFHNAWGAIHFYSTEPAIFDDHEVHLLEELAADLSYAIESLERDDQRMQVEKALRASEERFSTAFHASPVPMTITTLEDGTFIDINESFLKLLGYTREEIIGQVPAKIGIIIDVEEQQARRELLTLGQPVRDKEVRLRTKSGEERVVLASIDTTELGGKKCALGVAIDITERKLAEEASKRAEQALAAERLMLRTVIDNLPDQIYVKDTSSQFILCNKAVALNAGAASGQDLIGKTDFDLFPRELAKQYLADEQTIVISGQPLIDREEPIVNKRTGERQWNSTTKVPLKDNTGKIFGLVGVNRDITKRKRSEEEIRKLNEELEQRLINQTGQLAIANKELEAFAYSVSHDLRAPLRHIDGFIDLLHKKIYATLDEESKRFLSTIATSAKEMGTLIDDLLAFSRMGRAELVSKKVDLGSVVRAVIKELSRESEGRKIKYTVGDLPLVTGDSSMLRLVMVNLISNAIKFTRPQKKATIEIGSMQDKAAEITIFVRDNGVGFDMDYADKLFGVFQRLHGKDEFEGTGIGLASVRRIINRHGGRTWAEGSVDGGATFYFSLPR
ncbi:MAG: GAF domain-containing protein [Ignavibacteria bacterium]|nr:GAF domain-containing protein [Ignavibacteria bacterium]